MQQRVFEKFLADLQSEANDVELANKNLVVGHTSLEKNHSDAQRTSTATRVPDERLPQEEKALETLTCV